MSEEQPPIQPETIEVGETGDTLRYWLAKEAIRHAEARLGAQAASLTALESRAVSILGWAVTGVFALGAAATTGHYRDSAMTAAVFLFLASLLSIYGLWPQKWGVAGYMPLAVLDSGQLSELETLEHIAQGYDATITQNEKRLWLFTKAISGSWLCFGTAPVVAGLLAYFDTATYPSCSGAFWAGWV